MATRTAKKKRGPRRVTAAMVKANRDNGKKGGRPAVLTDDDWNAVLDGLESGDSLRSTCKRLRTPTVKTVLRRVTREPDGYGQRYAQAREIGSSRWKRRCYRWSMIWTSQRVNPS